jgi:hypothetical protein
LLELFIFEAVSNDCHGCHYAHVCCQAAKAIAKYGKNLMNLKAFGFHAASLPEHDPAHPGAGTQLLGFSDCKGSSCAALNALWNTSPSLAAAGITLGEKYNADTHPLATWLADSGLCVPAHMKAVTLMVPGCHSGIRWPLHTTGAQNLRWLKISLDTRSETALCRALATDCPHLQHLYLRSGGMFSSGERWGGAGGGGGASFGSGSGAKEIEAGMALKYLGQSLTKLQVLSVARACKEEVKVLLTGTCAKTLRYLEVDVYSSDVRSLDQVADCDRWRRLCGLEDVPPMQATLVLDFGFGSACIWDRDAVKENESGWHQTRRLPDDVPSRQLKALQARFFADLAASIPAAGSGAKAADAEMGGKSWTDVSAADLRRILLSC